ncbi:hypothetical protein [Pseudomonas syringae]|nr:hypothetical protein [Pseudomonas syringae]
MVYRLKMEDAGIVVGKAGQRCALTALQGGMPRRSAVDTLFTVKLLAGVFR